MGAQNDIGIQAQQIHKIMDGQEDYLGIDAVNGRIRVFVKSIALKNELEVVSDRIDIMVGRKTPCHYDTRRMRKN